MAAKKKALKRKAQVQQHSFAGRTAGTKGVAELHEVEIALSMVAKGVVYSRKTNAQGVLVLATSYGQWRCSMTYTNEIALRTLRHAAQDALLEIDRRLAKTAKWPY